MKVKNVLSIVSSLRMNCYHVSGLLLDPGTGEAWAASPSAYHRGCWHRHASTLHCVLSIVHGPGAGRRALAVTLLSGPCLALLVFHTFFGLIFIGESLRNWIPGPSRIFCLISVVGLLFSERILSMKS